jgi:hypothetical protein
MRRHPERAASARRTIGPQTTGAAEIAGLTRDRSRRSTRMPTRVAAAPGHDPTRGLPLDPTRDLAVDPMHGLPLVPMRGLPLDPMRGLPLDPTRDPPLDPTAHASGRMLRKMRAGTSRGPRTIQRGAPPPHRRRPTRHCVSRSA